MKLVGILLIVFGIVALTIGGINYTKRDKIVDIGPIHATAEHEKTIPLPPVVGIISLIGGVVIVASGARSRA